MYRSNLPQSSIIEMRTRSRFPLVALFGFILLSAGFAFATVMVRSDGHVESPTFDPYTAQAEGELRKTLDRRLHLRLKAMVEATSK